MDIILLERVGKLGIIGQIVSVKPGYARNYLLPRKKALRATKENIEYFAKQRVVLEANLEKQKIEAEQFSEQLENKSVILIRQASEAGQLYGSVSSRDIVEALKDQGFSIKKQHVILDHPIKTLGIHVVQIHLHSEVSVPFLVNIALTEEEALKQQEKLNHHKKLVE
jgi:large subunit ribosomal protein L9